MANYKTITVTLFPNYVEIELNRPEVHNALTPEMIVELTRFFQSIPSTFLCVIVKGKGKSFCSGADLNWMKESLEYDSQKNYHDVEALYTLFETIDCCPIPVLTAVQGTVLGGGMGLIAASDYVIAEQETRFSLSEVTLGLIPACVAPFLIPKIGMSWCRALFLSAERFDAKKAYSIGLIHEVVSDTNTLESTVSRLRSNILKASPQASRVAKHFLRHTSPFDLPKTASLSIQTLADLRQTPEAQEGIRAFLEKRSPHWNFMV